MTNRGGDSRVGGKGEVLSIMDGKEVVVREKLDSHVEDALAFDVASGLPRVSLMAKYALKGAELTKVMEKPRVAMKVEGFRGQLEDSVVRLHHRMAIRSSDILDGIMESSLDEDCPHRFSNGRYIIDKLLPNVSYAISDNKHTVDFGAMEVFNEGAKALESFVAKGEKVVIDIKEDDPHLHNGKDFIDARDKGIAGLGSSE